MERVTIRIEGSEDLRASEVLADLRNVAEALFHPLRLVAYWDGQDDGRHPCPQTDRSEPCPHRQPDAADYVPFDETVDRELHGQFAVHFPHADVTIYLGPAASILDALKSRKSS